MRRSIVILTGLLMAVLTLAASAHGDDPVTLRFFGAEGCPYCARMETFLDQLEARHGEDLVIERHEVSHDAAARERWVEALADLGERASAVPTTILGDRVWIGFDGRVAAEIDAAVSSAIEARARAPDEPSGEEPSSHEPSGAAQDDETVVDVPLLGTVDVTGRSAIAATLLLAFIDGFNPCSLWVLTVLLAMVLNAGANRGRVALIGGVFLAVTGVLYGAFIAGIFTVLGFIEHLGALRMGVAAIAVFVGAVNVKDYVAYKRGLSFTIPDRFKPRIYRGGRSIRDTEQPLAAVLGTTVAMAAGIALIELPCTAGFPVVWSGIMRSQEVEGVAFAGLLGAYLAVYVLDELVLFAAVVLTLRVARFQERHGRLLKLLSGAVMLSLGAVLLAAPEVMEDPVGATLVVSGSVATALVVDRADRHRRARRSSVARTRAE